MERTYSYMFANKKQFKAICVVWLVFMVKCESNFKETFTSLGLQLTLICTQPTLKTVLVEVYPKCNCSNRCCFEQINCIPAEKQAFLRENVAYKYCCAPSYQIHITTDEVVALPWSTHHFLFMSMYANRETL